jgi:hypothetical protein
LWISSNKSKTGHPRRYAYHDVLVSLGRITRALMNDHVSLWNNNARSSSAKTSSFFPCLMRIECVSIIVLTTSQSSLQRDSARGSEWSGTGSVAHIPFLSPFLLPYPWPPMCVCLHFSTPSPTGETQTRKREKIPPFHISPKDHHKPVPVAYSFLH